MLNDIKVDDRWLTSRRINGTKQWTRSYSLWQNMMSRCGKHRNYLDCSVSDDFQDYQYFANWCQSQIGYGLDGYHIDKDILVPGNREYCAETCVFVPQALNVFLTDREACRGVLPQGVRQNKKHASFIASVNIEGKLKHLGSFSTIPEAFAAYKHAKEKEARRWSDRLSSGEFIVDGRVIAAMQCYSILEKTGQFTPVTAE